MNTKSIYNGTPTISVIDNRGLQIRTLEYNHVIVEDPIEEYITRSTYTLLGSLDSSMDPRLFSKYQNESSTLPNMKYSHSLKGDELCTKSVDAGQKIQLFDIEGKLTWFMNANNTQTNIQYDSIGRPTSVFEKLENEELPKCRDRIIYGEDEKDAQANNLCGQLVRHYDIAGKIQTENFSLTGMPLYQSRRLLKHLDQPSNWGIDDENTWNNFLDTETYDTSWKYDAQGKTIVQIDAKGNLQTVAYNVVGQPKAVSLTLQGQTEQRIAEKIAYNAAGQIRRTETGNGILTEHRYEASTQRLIRKINTREQSSGKREVLQDYHYEYDPVGNILSISDESGAVRFFRNQRIMPKRQYTYDALYQLVSSTGRESDALRHSQSFPALITPMPLDDSQYVNYFEKYKYDRAGNLIKLSHKGAIQYNTDIHIDNTSNRGIWKQKNEIPNIADSFDRAGNQKFLCSGIPMEWDARNQLCRVNMVVRDEEDNDWESYIYDSSGIRIVKRNIRKTKSTTQTHTTVYLPGLELRTCQTGDQVTELLHVVTVDTEIVQVRVLHWEDGTQPNEVSNNQYRYSINDHLGSSMLELDMQGQIISKEEFYPYGGTAVWTARTEIEANYKTIRYSGKERDATGLYYYGHRYYMPWSGRWLNPDPAGTVDGLNLYRMVRNNPINLMDPDGNAPIEMTEYSKESGDLFYGISKERGKYIRIFNQNFNMMDQNSDPMVIDQYNNAISGLVWSKNSNLGDSENSKRYANKVKIPKDLRNIISNGGKRSYPLWEDYFDIGMENSKFNILKIYKDTADKFGKDYYHSYNSHGFAPKLLWKRGSKLGLEIAASNQRTKIHFVLDGLNIEHVVNKTKEQTNEMMGRLLGPGESITASELRYVYRNWDRLKNRVSFYRDNEKLDKAPWEENPSVWGAYKPTNRPVRKPGSKNCLGCLLMRR
ncbi:RHS repeat-associated core domain-containing protein [Bacillus cereus]|uniref:Toxin n=1 Tax=Bacillus cereus TaxID=1396 RepID=A0A9X7G8T5_BACCE|nr:RHS repeat-associated core domain-containing protein [Bacillus cereus]PED41285.1 toxin [Bacillus cereus]PFV08641.1 toxin [Bacillus cereus]